MGGVCCKSSEADKYEGGGKFTPKLNMEGCRESLEHLRAQGHTLILISYCGKNRARVTYPLVQFVFDEIYFVRSRDFKSIVCNCRAVDVMIDDRKDIIDNIQANCPTTFCIHFGNGGIEMIDGRECSIDDSMIRPIIMSDVEIKYLWVYEFTLRGFIKKKQKNCGQVQWQVPTKECGSRLAVSNGRSPTTHLNETAILYGS